MSLQLFLKHNYVGIIAIHLQLLLYISMHVLGLHDDHVSYLNLYQTPDYQGQASGVRNSVSGGC